MFLAGLSKISFVKSETMDRLLPESAADFSALDVMIVHEDNLTGVRAQKLFNRIMHYLQVSPRLGARFWEFDVLRNRALMESAARTARFSDIVILSIHARERLPAAVQVWIREWLRIRPDRPCSFVALLDEAETARDPHPLIARLRTLAEGAGLDFFYWIFGPQARNMDLNFSPAVHLAGPPKSRAHLAARD